MSIEFDTLREAIAQACRAHGVRRLDAFDSAVRADFDPKHSDVDFLVEFEAAPPDGAADRYFGLRESLRSLLGYPVDLVVDRAARNPYFRRAIARERRNVYAA